MLESLQVTPAQVFSCENCETFKSTYFEEHLRTDASMDSMKAEISRIKKNENLRVENKLLKAESVQIFGNLRHLQKSYFHEYF